MSQLPILYSRTSKGQVQTWQIFVKDDTFHTAEGIKWGTISVSKPTICQKKNVGRANETSAEEQAILEAKAKWQKKIDGGYFENEADIDKVTTFWPMLAEKWKDYKDAIVERFEKKETVYCQAKLDGMRCIVKKDGMWSREGKPIKSAPHIRRLLDPLFVENPNLVLDGELYNHKFKHNFNKIISLAKKQKPTDEQLAESEQLLQYWIYDYVFEYGEKDQFSLRMEDGIAAIDALYHKHKEIAGIIRWVKTYECKSIQEIEDLFKKFVDEGFEGLMVRADESYLNKRTKFLLKYKEFLEEEYSIDDIEEGDGNRAGLATTVYFHTKDGKPFKAGVIGNDDYTRELLKNKKKYIGKPGTVVFFNLTPDGLPRFGKMKIVRDYE